jgi:hypothetical protein
VEESSFADHRGLSFPVEAGIARIVLYGTLFPPSW